MSTDEKKKKKKMAAATAEKYTKLPVHRGFVARFPLAIQAVTLVSVFGTRKHEVPLDDMSYLGVPDAYAVYTEATERHLIAEAVEGLTNREDGDLLHAAQAAWNAMARLEVLLRQHVAYEQRLAAEARGAEKSETEAEAGDA